MFHPSGRNTSEFAEEWAVELVVIRSWIPKGSVRLRSTDGHFHEHELEHEHEHENHSGPYCIGYGERDPTHCRRPQGWIPDHSLPSW